MTRLSATVFGATGLVGKKVVEQLCENEDYQTVFVPNRREITYKNEKIEARTIDFDQLESNTALFEVDHIFICLGTTIKKAGSQEAFQKVDLELPKRIATMAAQNSVKAVVLISSIGADADSSNFYLKTKGQTEGAVIKALNERAYIVRPSMLLGDREEFRLGEEIGKFLVKGLYFLIPKKYRGIYDYEVAAAMIQLAQKQPNKQVYRSDELKRIVQ
ncbi:MAG: NAD(P)H-binding protein [Vicingaceae bacterium]